jgi:hypothetical protein
MADHEADLEADFLRFYRIDQTRLDGPHWVRLAQRVAAYGGVMTRRIEQRREQAEAPASPRQAPAGEQEMELAAFRLAHPGVVTVTRASEEG